MKRTLVTLAAAVVAWLLMMAPALAALHDVSVGNYYYQDDATGARTLEVKTGDQIRFTIRQGDYPPHSVNVDELGVHSGDLLLFQTYTTAPLKKPGTFVLYCTAHRDQGHWTKLRVVPKAAPAATPAAKPSAASTPSTAPRTSATAQSRARTSTARRAPPKTPPVTPGVVTTNGETVPSGVGEATDRRRDPPGPNSVQALLGRDFSASGPWTRALFLALLAGVPIAGVTALALRLELARGARALGQPTTADLPVDVKDVQVGSAQEGSSDGSDTSRTRARRHGTPPGPRVPPANGSGRRTPSPQRKASSRRRQTARSKT